MRLLVWPGPDVHVVQVLILALKRKWSGFGPCAQDQVMRLVESVVALRGIDAGAVIFRSDAANEASDEAPACYVVENGEFLRDHERIVQQGKRAAEDGDLGVF